MKTYQDMHIIGITIHMEKIRRFMYGFTIKEENIMVVINEEVKDETYEKLIEYAFKKCDAVMFAFYTHFESDKKATNKIKDKLQQYNKYLIIEKDQSLDETLIYREGMKIALYKATDEIKEYLLSNKEIYKWHYPKYPTDVSFFKNGKCWMHTIAHEEMLQIYYETEEEFNYLKSIGIKFLEPKYEKTPEEYLIFEEY